MVFHNSPKCKLRVPLFMNYWCQMENYDCTATSSWQLQDIFLLTP